MLNKKDLWNETSHQIKSAQTKKIKIKTYLNKNVYAQKVYTYS